MKIDILEESSDLPALYGIGLSYGKTSNISYEKFKQNPDLIEKIRKVSMGLYNRDGGHNKFLETIIMWANINAPRYFWQEFDTYRVGMTKQSESTIHVLMKDQITQEMFSSEIPENYLEYLEKLRMDKDLNKLKANLPEGFLQKRTTCFNYKTLRNIISQRKNHKLQEWREFCYFMFKNAKYKNYLQDLK